jgi:hypothetical protein
MEQLIYEVNGIRYLLFSAICQNEYQSDKLIVKAHLNDGIIQKVHVSDTFFGGTKVSIDVLIPEENAIKFSRS